LVVILSHFREVEEFQFVFCELLADIGAQISPNFFVPYARSVEVNCPATNSHPNNQTDAAGRCDLCASRFRSPICSTVLDETPHVGDGDVLEKTFTLGSGVFTQLAAL